MRVRSGLLCLVVAALASLAGCGGGGSSSGGSNNGGGGGGSNNPTLSSISVSPASPSVVLGATEQFTATGSYSDGSTKDLTSTATWTSSNTSIATVSSSGLATTVATGYSTITATSGSISGSATLMVTGPILSSITVTPAAPSINVSATQQFIATGHYSDGSTGDITSSCSWNSSNTSVATIAGTGLATGVSGGSTTITAADGNISGTTTLTVTAPVLTSIAITPALPQVAVGATVQLTATATYADNSTKDVTSTVTWSSDNTSVASVSSAGVLTGVATGSTAVHAAISSVEGSTSVTVTPSSLAAWWRFNEAGGATAADSSGNGHNANLYGGITFTSGQTGGGIIANGASQLMQSSAIDLSTTHTLTLAGWMARAWTGSGTKVLAELGYDYSKATDGFVFYVDDTTDCGASPAIYIGFTGDVGSTFNCYAPPSDGKWHHVAMVLDKSKADSTAIQLYFDGALQTILSNVSSSSNTNNFGSEQLYMFSQSGTKQFASGMVSDLRLYSRALSSTEIGQLYTLGSTTATVQSLTLSPLTPGIAVGQTLQFDALGNYSDSSKRDLSTAVSWNSSSASTATVVPGGLATGVADGTSTIMATSGSISASTTLTVGTTATVPGYLVQFATGDDGPTGAATSYLGAPMTAGNMLLVFSHWDDHTITATVSDSEGDTFTPIVGPIDQGSERFEIWYAKNIVGGTPTGIKVTYSGTTTKYSLVDVAEYGGLDKTAPFVTSAHAVGAGTDLDSGSITVPSANSETIIGIFGDDAYVNPFTPGTNFTMDGFDASTMYERQGAATAGSYNATATSEGTANWIAVVMAFKNYSN